MTTTADHTRAEQLEARARKAMAEVTRAPRGWIGESDRREDIARVDVWLDAWLGVVTISLWLFGIQVMCFTIGPPDAAATEGAELAGGTTAGYFMAPNAKPEIPDEIPGVDRNNGWGDEENLTCR